MVAIENSKKINAKNVAQSIGRKGGSNNELKPEF